MRNSFLPSWVRASIAGFLAGLAACSNSPTAGDDADGVVGGDYTFVLTADDMQFSPTILKAQNSAMVHLTLNNAGKTPHGFQISEFAGATIAPIAPGANATVNFTTPYAEAIYTIRSTEPGDTFTAQFIVQ